MSVLSAKSQIIKYKFISHNLGYFKMSQKCVVNFMKSQWNNLELLYLCNCLIKIVVCHLENESMKVFSKCWWKSLQQFLLKYNYEIGDSGVDYLGCSNWLELHIINLCKCFIVLDYTKVTNFGVMSWSKWSLKQL